MPGGPDTTYGNTNYQSYSVNVNGIDINWQDSDNDSQLSEAELLQAIQQNNSQGRCNHININSGMEIAYDSGEYGLHNNLADGILNYANVSVNLNDMNPSVEPEEAEIIIETSSYNSKTKRAMIELTEQIGAEMYYEGYSGTVNVNNNDFLNYKMDFNGNEVTVSEFIKAKKEEKALLGGALQAILKPVIEKDPVSKKEVVKVSSAQKINEIFDKTADGKYVFKEDAISLIKNSDILDNAEKTILKNYWEEAKIEIDFMILEEHVDLKDLDLSSLGVDVKIIDATAYYLDNLKDTMMDDFFNEFYEDALKETAGMSLV